MATAQQWLDVVSNNLANLSTTAYKKDGLSFADGFVRALAADAGQGELLGTLGSGSIVQGQYTDFSPGALEVTGNNFDFGITGPDGGFAVETPGGILYTRNGSFHIDGNLVLVDTQNNPVLDRQGQRITVPEGTFKALDDGSLTVDEKPIGKLGVFAGKFTKLGGGYYASADAAPLDRPSVAWRALESSNVNAIEEMIAMIRINRAFEMAQRTVVSQDESTQRLISSVQGR